MIKQTCILVSFASILFSAASASATPQDELGAAMGVYMDRAMSPRSWGNYTLEDPSWQPSRCREYIAKAKKAGVKDDDEITGDTYLQHVPGAKEAAVQKYSTKQYVIKAKQAAWVCDQFALARKKQDVMIRMEQAQDVIAYMPSQNPADVGDTYATSAIDGAKQCLADYDAAIKAGLDPATKVEIKGKETAFSEGKALCEKALKIAQDYEVKRGEVAAAKREQIAAKYTPHGIAGDRLELFIQYDNVTWMGPGCKDIEDIAKLAKAKKLYQWLENADGTHTIRTYTFKGNKYKAKDKTYKKEAQAWKGCK